jgi:DNA-3-methyladenine glycosylase
VAEPRLRVPAAERQRLLAILGRAPALAARGLLGSILVRRHAGRVLRARIVEVEAYEAEADPAAHAFRGRTARNAPVFGPPGTLYVYFIYGMYHCLNIAAEPEGRGGCLLIRAAEPCGGAVLPPRALSGPGRLCRALGIDRGLSGLHVFDPRAGLTLREGEPPRRIAVSPRIGIRRAAERPLRFYDRDSNAVS